MKKLFLLFALAFGLSFSAGAQDTKEVYCEIVGRATFSFTGKIKIEVDFGQENKVFEGINNDVLKDPATGKPKKFNSMIDALNFMAADGWIFVNAYNVPGANSENEYHYVMRKTIKKQ